MVTFSANVGTPYLPPSGVTDRFAGGLGDTYVYLDLTDGSRVRFLQNSTYHPPIGGEPGWYEYTIGLPDQITDPHGNITTFTYTAGKLTKVTEPAGRYLTISYGTNGYVSEVDSYTASNHWTQWVKYTYATQSFGGVNYVVLTKADYIYSPGGEPQPVATYTYQTSNTSTTGNPLISTCRDVRYPGPMKNIKYAFVTTSPLSYGQLYQELNVNSTLVAQLTISGLTRTETRGDGTNSVRGAGNPTRTFTYGGSAGGVTKNYLLKNFTDFKGQTTTLAYNADGFISSRTTNGHTTSFTYLNQEFPTGVVSKITHPGDNSTVQYFYTDPSGAYLDHVTDELGHTTTYRRNSGTMTTYEIDYPDLGIETYTYNSFGQVLTHTMPSNTGAAGSGGTETYAYDEPDHPGQLTSYTPPDTSSDGNPGAHPTQYAYDINDHLSTTTDPKGNVITFYSNEIGQVTIEQHDDTDESMVVYSYNADGTLASKNAQLNAATWALTSYVYDDYKRPITVTDPAGNITTLYYDSAGGTSTGLAHTDANVTRLKLPSAKVTQTLYDENLQKGQVTVGLGTTAAAVTTYTYDAAGNLKTMKDPNGQTTGATWTYNYDVRERLINVTDPVAADRNSNGHTVDYTYDWSNNKLTETRTNNQLITYDSYNEMNRLTQMTAQQDPTADAVTKYTWTKAGKMLTMVDPKSHTYTYTYDRLNRLITTKYPLYNGVNPTENYLYDIAGNLYQFTNRNGDLQTFSYDSRNREISYNWSSGSPQARTLTYDDASRITACDTSSTHIIFTYYDDNRLHTQEEWTSYWGDNTHRTLTYTYDVDGNKTSVALPGTTTIGYTYTNRNQMNAVTSGVGGGSYADYTYDKNGNMLTRSPNNSTSSAFAYDSVNRVTAITHNFVGNTRTLNYAYDAMGRQKYVQRVGDNVGDDGYVDSQGNTYDLNSQARIFIRNGTLSGGTVTGGTATTFNFDASGNRSTVVSGGTTTTYTTNNLNQYATITGLANPTYDNNGNLLTNGAWTYTYDSMNRLTKATNGTTTEQFWYDGLNRQIARSASWTSTRTMSVFDGWNLFGEFAATSTTPLKRLVYGPGGDLVMNSFASRYYYPDALGSTAYLAGQVGSLLEGYSYDLYGTPTFYDLNGNPHSPNQSSYGITELFTGQPWHAEISLYDNRNRFLLPSLGRFLQPDPIGFAGDAANLYRYCANNPTNATDPTGLDAYPLWYGGYYYRLQPGLDLNVLKGNPVRNPYPGYDRQCATGGQYWAGTMRPDGVHDVPKVSTWTQGAPTGADTMYGTLIATGWEWGKYPNRPVSFYCDNETINHVALFVADLGNGWIRIFDQSSGKDPGFRDVKSDGWYIVNGKGEYDKAATDSYIAWRTAGLAAIRAFGAQTARQIFGRIDGMSYIGSIDGFNTWNGLGSLPVSGVPAPSSMETTAQP